MSKSMWKKIGISLLGLVVIFALCLAWLMSLLDHDRDKAKLAATTRQDILYLNQSVTPQRGKILAVVTSTAKMGSKRKKTGYELTELARAYYVFQANGFEVDIASTQGGKAPAVIDDDDMGEFDYAFLNDASAMKKVENSMNIKDVKAEHYQAIYFVGGKGSMFDFPESLAIQNLVLDFDKNNKVIAAVCHGSAAFTQVIREDGTPYLNNKRVSAFTNEEELFLIPKAKELFPFLLEDELRKRGAKFEAGAQYLEQVSQDSKLITGQNPWSVWRMAEAVVQQLGYQPLVRERTSEEISIDVLIALEKHGYEKAQAHLLAIFKKPNASINRDLIAMHALVAVMSHKPGKSVDLLRLLYEAKRLAGEG